MCQLLMVPSAVQWLETDTPTAPWYALPCLGDDLRVHARYYHMNVRVCHPLGFCHHHCLVLDPALTAGFPQVGQKSGLVRQYLRESGVLGVVVQDGVEVPVIKIRVEIPAQVFLRHPFVDLGLLLRCGPMVRSPLDPLGVDPV